MRRRATTLSLADVKRYDRMLVANELRGAIKSTNQSHRHLHTPPEPTARLRFAFLEPQSCATVPPTFEHSDAPANDQLLTQKYTPVRS